MSPTDDPLITLRRADEAMKLIDRSNTWESAVGRIKWVMDTLGPIAEVRVISFCLSFTEPTFSQLSPYAKMAYSLLLAIPKVHPLRHCWNETLMLCLSGR